MTMRDAVSGIIHRDVGERIERRGKGEGEGERSADGMEGWPARIYIYILIARLSRNYHF